jgi:hypothetical protein
MANQRIWLWPGADEVRPNITTMGDVVIATYQSHVETFVVTIDTIRNVPGQGWSPREVSIAYRPRALLERRLWRPYGTRSPGQTRAGVARPLPENLHGLVQLQVGELITDPALGIDVVAESWTTSRCR